MVSLAHHVVSLWFLSCKFPLRKQFVRFIVQGFRNNVLIPCEEGMIAQNSSAAAAAAATASGTPGAGAVGGDGGSDAGGGRVRSGSLSSHDARRTATPRPANAGDGSAGKCIQDETRITFHRELMETCADLMSRYTYGNSAPYAQQSETVARILKVFYADLI